MIPEAITMTSPDWVNATEVGFVRVGTSCMGTYYVLNTYYVLYFTYNALHTYRAKQD